MMKDGADKKVEENEQANKKEQDNVEKIREEIKDKAVAIAKNIASKIEIIFVPGGVSGLISKGPNIGGSKKKDDTPSR